MGKARKPTVFLSNEQIFNDVINSSAQNETPNLMWSAELVATPEENGALIAVGKLLGSHCRRETGTRCRLGQGEKYAAVEERVQQIKPECGTAWAYNITRIAGDIWEHALRADKQDLRATLQEVEYIKARGKVRIVENGSRTASSNSDNQMTPYETTAIRREAMDRMQRLATKAETLDQMISSGQVSIGFGSYELTRGRHNLKEAGYETVEEWRQDWDFARWFLMAEGTEGVSGGNACLRVNFSDETEDDGIVEVALPRTLAHLENTPDSDPWFRLSERLRCSDYEAWAERARSNKQINYSLVRSRREPFMWGPGRGVDVFSIAGTQATTGIPKTRRDTEPR